MNYKEVQEYIEKNNNKDINMIFNELKNKINNDILNFIFYDKFNFEYDKNEDIEINKQLRDDRDGQEEFRNNLVELDQHCIISEDDPDICQACHIIPYCESNSYDINNGILLNLILHNMFDKFYLSFEFIKNIDNNYDEYKVILSDKIKDKPSYQNYKCYDNKIVQIRRGCRNNLLNTHKKFKFEEMA